MGRRPRVVQYCHLARHGIMAPQKVTKTSGTGALEKPPVESGEKYGKVGQSGEKLLKVMKSGEKWIKVEKVVKSGEM